MSEGGFPSGINRYVRFCRLKIWNGSGSNEELKQVWLKSHGEDIRNEIDRISKGYLLDALIVKEKAILQ